MLWDTESAVQQAARTPATGLPVEMGMEAVSAGYKFTVDEEKSTSLERALWDEYDTYLDQIEQRTGKRLQNPIGFAPRERAPVTGGLGAQVRLRREQEAIGDPVTGMPGFEAQLAKLRETTPDLPEPPTAGQLLDNITKRLGLAREQYQDLQSRMSAGGSIASFIGSMGGLATDPLVAATMPFGAGASRPLVAKMLIEAGIAGASELAVQPYVMRGKEAIESPYSMADAATNVLAAAGLGAAFPAAGALLHGLGSKGVRALERAFDRETPTVRAATKTERAAMADLERAFTTEETSPTAPADLPAHVQALDAEVATVRETGAPSRDVPEVPIEPERAAIVEAEQKAARPELEALAREDEQLAGAIEAVQSIRVYHGSPHRFDRFSMEHLGSGEGAQAYGHGLYFAENRNIAEHYQKALRDRVPVPEDGDTAYWVAQESRAKTKDEAIAWIDEYLAEADAGKLDFDITAQDRADLAAAKAKIEAEGLPELAKSNLYTVDLNVQPDELLDWDAPLSKQGEKIRQAAETFRADIDQAANKFIDRDAAAMFGLGDTDVLTGKDLHDAIAARSGKKATADELRALGIKGIRYWDAGSREKGAGTRNIVMFDDSLIRIREINGVPIPDPAEAAKDLAEFTGSKAEDAILTADVERALGAKPPPVAGTVEPPNLEMKGSGPVAQQVADDTRMARAQADRLGLTVEIERLSYNGLTAAQTAKAIGDQLEEIDRATIANEGDSPANLRKGREQFVRLVRNTLGIPSMDDHAEYAAWRSAYEQRAPSYAPAPDAPKPAEPPKPTLDPELARIEVPVGEAIDPDTGERIATTRTAAELLDELEADQRVLDEMSNCAAPLPTQAAKG